MAQRDLVLRPAHHLVAGAGLVVPAVRRWDRNAPGERVKPKPISKQPKLKPRAAHAQAGDHGTPQGRPAAARRRWRRPPSRLVEDVLAPAAGAGRNRWRPRRSRTELAPEIEKPEPTARPDGPACGPGWRSRRTCSAGGLLRLCWRGTSSYERHLGRRSRRPLIIGRRGGRADAPDRGPAARAGQGSLGTRHGGDLRGMLAEELIAALDPAPTARSNGDARRAARPARACWWWA
jgi:hypothetical protein